MAEDNQAAGGEAADPAGVALALTGASRAEADAHLRDQRHHIHEQLKQVRLTDLAWRGMTGEALVWSGRPNQAKSQFQLAARLDPIPAEKAELARESALG